jgi:hypothetical protein
MFLAKTEKRFLSQLRHDSVKANAANVLRRFSLKVIEAKRRKKLVSDNEVEAGVAARKQKSFDALFEIAGRCVLYAAVAKWRQATRDARSRALKETLVRCAISPSMRSNPS